MLVMVLLGLLIPLGVGVLALMEFKAPPPTAVAVVQPLAETTVGISDSHDALAKADRLDVTTASTGLSAFADSETPAVAGSETPAPVSSETPPQPAPAGERMAPSMAPPSEGVTTGASESVGPSTPPSVIKRHRHDPKPRPRKVVTVAVPKPKPKPIETSRTVVSERPRSAGDTGACRLSAFGGLQKALNSADCEI
jgi:hypothetical protein